MGSMATGVFFSWSTVSLLANWLWVLEVVAARIGMALDDGEPRHS
jgi:hypothetical protein